MCKTQKGRATQYNFVFKNPFNEFITGETVSSKKMGLAASVLSVGTRSMTSWSFWEETKYVLFTSENVSQVTFAAIFSNKSTISSQEQGSD